MLKIAICDDEKVFRDNINKYVAAYLNEKEISYEIDTFSSGKEIIDLGIEIKQYNIIFLDINMDDVDGIVTAQKIREYSSEIYIVFVTAYINYSLEGYKVDAKSSPNLCVNSSSSYISPSMLPLSSGDLIEWSLVCHSILSYQKFCD